MLISLSIKNYALIDELQVNFDSGFTIITGETGAGKSILLGGLSLILGKRADLSSLRIKEQKCIIEACFDISNYNLKTFFLQNDLDFENQTIIRREILPSGKSRAFVNDSPVTLNILKILGANLLDIHSQNETLQLVDDAFQFQVIDALSNNKQDLLAYTSELLEYKKQKKELETLIIFQSEAVKEHDYNTFLLNELVALNLKEGELSVLEEEYATLDNIETLQEKLTSTNQLLSDEQIGVISTLARLVTILKQLSGFSNKYEELYTRTNSCFLELEDVFEAVEKYQDELEVNPNRLEVVSTKLTTINNMFQKHVVADASSLLEVKNKLEEKVLATKNVETDIANKQENIKASELKLNTLAKSIHKKRVGVLPKLKTELETILTNLGMPNAQFDISLNITGHFYYNGKEALSFLFSANKGGLFQSLKKAASGGELSRIMLAIKSVLTRYKKLPTIMFDEIDTGVSGEVSNKMADIMSQMSTTMQVFSITHLPQIAAKGQSHFKVYKKDVNEITTTHLIKLSQEQRIVEIAQMLGGKTISNSALEHAKQLLN